MYSLSDPAVISQRTAIDAQIIELHRAVSELRYKRNILLPISSLCPEILLQIFEHAVQNASGTRDETLRRLRASHVCRHWRDILLSTASFWSIIRPAPGQQGALLDCFLERSRSAPIRLVLDSALHETPPTRLLEKVLGAHHQRISSLDLWLQYDSQAAYVWEALEKHKPPLVHLNVASYLRPTSAAHNYGRKLSSLFPTLRSLTVMELGEAPQTLAFADWAFPCTLTSLDMTYQSTVNSSRPAILEALRPLQSLRMLRLRHAIPLHSSESANITAPGDSLSNSHTLTLPELQSLTLKGLGEATVQLLQSLVLTALTHVDVELHIPSFDARSGSILRSSIFPVVNQALSSPQYPRSSKAATLRQIANSTFGSVYRHGMSFQWATHFVSDVDFMDPSFPTHKFDHYVPHSTVTLTIPQAAITGEGRKTTQNLLDEVYSQGLSGLRSVKIFRIFCSATAFDQGIILPNTIRSMSELRVLSFHYSGLALHDLPAVFAHGADGRPPFPHLHTLQFGYERITPEFLEVSASILCARETAGMGRLRLIFINCSSRTVSRDVLQERLAAVADVQFHRRDGSSAHTAEWADNWDECDSDEDNSDEDDYSDEDTDDLDNYEVTFEDLDYDDQSFY